jgi:hypothetical protein
MIENRIMSRQPGPPPNGSYLGRPAAHACVLLRLAPKRLALPCGMVCPGLIMLCRAARRPVSWRAGSGSAPFPARHVARYGLVLVRERAWEPAS